MSERLDLDSRVVLWSAGDADRTGRPLLVLLHGYGSDEGDLFGLSPHLPLGPAIASVRAPIPEAGGWAWFSAAGFVDGEPTSAQADAAAVAVLRWLDALPAAPPSIAVLGFSQGATVALQLLRRAPGRFACQVALAGPIAPGGDPADAVLADLRPTVFWGRGTVDRVIPSAAIDRTAAWIPARTTPDIRIYEGLAHGVSEDELADVSRYLAERI